MDSDLDIFVVAGAKSLADDSAARWWAQRILERTAIRITAGGEIVIADERGPAAWAKRIGVGLRSARVFGLDGWVRRHWIQGNGELGRAPVRQWTKSLSPDPEDHAGRQEWALARDRAMVAAVAKEAAKGASVLVLGITDPRAKPGSAEHVLALAEAAGLPVWSQKYLGPLDEG